MATLDDVRRIALALPETVEGTRTRFVVSVRRGGGVKDLAWVWLERIDPEKARVPNPQVLGVRVSNLDEKEIVLSLDERKFFTEPHYNGYPAVLVRLAEVEMHELEALLTHAWTCQAPKKLVKISGIRSGLEDLLGL